MNTSEPPVAGPHDPTPREDQLREQLTALQAEADDVEMKLSEAQSQIDEILRGAPTASSENAHD